MNIFRMKKQLKRRWRRWKRAIWTIAACGLVGIMAWLGMPLSEQVEKLMARDPLVLETFGKIHDTGTPETSIQWLDDLQKSNQARIVHLNKIYTCGEESSILGIMKPDEIAELLKSHPDWEGRIGAGGDIWLNEHIAGLSEICQSKGYIGIDKDGNLTLFEGPPKDEKVLRTFFQIDVGTMESALPEEVLKQLYSGIRIQDIDEYNSVISTFGDFAVEPTERALQQN